MLSYDSVSAVFVAALSLSLREGRGEGGCVWIWIGEESTGGRDGWKSKVEMNLRIEEIWGRCHMLMLWGASDRPADWGGGGFEIILDSKNENETGEESRTDSPVNGKSSSILLPVCLGASFLWAWCFQRKYQSDTVAGRHRGLALRCTLRDAEKLWRAKEKMMVLVKFPQRKTCDRERRRRKTAAHTIEQAGLREDEWARWQSTVRHRSTRAGESQHL